MVGQHLAAYGPVTKTSEMVGRQLDVRCKTLRRWVCRPTSMAGQRDGVPTTTSEDPTAL